MAGRWELTDVQWELVEPILCPARRKDNRSRPWHDTRAVLRGVFWVQIGFWDALIVASALKSGATRILSEDLNAGQMIAGIWIKNPFAGIR